MTDPQPKPNRQRRSLLIAAALTSLIALALLAAYRILPHGLEAQIVGDWIEDKPAPTNPDNDARNWFFLKRNGTFSIGSGPIPISDYSGWWRVGPNNTIEFWYDYLPTWMHRLFNEFNAMHLMNWRVIEAPQHDNDTLLLELNDNEHYRFRRR